jgi:riboflavin synthase
MFTGIIEETGEVLASEVDDTGRRLRIACSFTGLDHGQSVAVDGACLTVEATGERHGAAAEPTRPGNWFEVFLAAETVDRTVLDERAVGDRVNLERAMPADGRFDGHVVQGHVDGVTTITDVARVGDDWRYTFDLPPAHEAAIVEKGSVTIDGISLTVAGVDEVAGTFDVAIIPTTDEETTLSARGAGDGVHLEVDVLAKYVQNAVANYLD